MSDLLGTGAISQVVSVPGEQSHLLLISLVQQHNSMSDLLGTGAICMNTTINFVALYNDFTRNYRRH